MIISALYLDRGHARGHTSTTTIWNGTICFLCVLISTLCMQLPIIIKNKHFKVLIDIMVNMYQGTITDERSTLKLCTP